MKTIYTAALLALALALAGCGKSAEEKALEDLKEAQETLAKKADQPPETIEEAVNQLTKALGDMGESVETIAAKDLKAMLPESLGDMKRTKASASKNGAFGYSVSTAEAVYESKDDNTRSRITVSINDIGSMQGMARMGLGWLNMEMDEETETGFNRTTEYKGHKAIEHFEDNGASMKGQKSVFVDGRFLVDVSGHNVTFEEIEKVVASLPLDDLESMNER